MKDDVELQIDELVLNGFAGADRHAIGEAVERELARLLMEQGATPAVSKETAELRRDSPQLTASGDARTTGAEVAKAIYGGVVE